MLNEFICPHCGHNIKNPYHLLTSYQLKNTVVFDKISVDKKYIEFTEGYGGIIPSQSTFKQIVYKDTIPEVVKPLIRDNKLALRIGNDKIDQLACPRCHSNVTPLYDPYINRVLNILLVGMTGSSKTTLVASICKTLSDRFLSNKNEKITHAASTKSFEYNYYSEIAGKFPVVAGPTVSDENFFNRQPLFFVKVGSDCDKTLIIFHDYPGESLKQSAIFVNDNTVPVYLYDNSKSDDEQLQFFSKKIIELHDGRSFEKELLSYVKCDKLPKNGVQRIMLKAYEESHFKSFNELLAARRMALDDLKITGNPLYNKIADYCPSPDVSCVAALGCSAEEVKGQGHFVLKGKWNPLYLYDFILTIGA